MRNSFFFWILGLLVSETVCAQKEMNNWFFGLNGGINFSSGVPVFVPGSVRSTAGTSAISDPSGNLLFYTDGMTVWNSQHKPMPSGQGLNGVNTHTESSIIVPHPGNANSYYIFTLNADDRTKGLQYSTVNTSLDGGLGDVETKNTLLYNYTCEKIAAVKHANGRDTWVITHVYGTNDFVVYLIDVNGLNPVPLLQKVGSDIKFLGDSRGYMKVSPNGKKIALAYLESFIEVLDFDVATGLISNPTRIHGAAISAPCGQYGLEFSCNSKLLYTSQLLECDFDKSYVVFQYELDLPTELDIIRSRIVVDSGLTGAAGALQLGPDNKIYIAYNKMNYLGCIREPNKRGAACDVVKQYIPLPDTVQSGSGLPVFVQRLTTFGCCDNILGNDTIICEGSTLLLQVPITNASVRWQDGSTGTSLLVQTQGQYIADITVNNCHTFDTINIGYKPAPVFNLGPDMVVCPDKFPVRIGQKVPGADILWQDGSKLESFTVTAPGKYWMNATMNGCTFSDSITVTEGPVPSFSLGADTAVCAGNAVTLEVRSNGDRYLWNDLSTNRSLTVTAPGAYWCQVTNAAGCLYSDTINVSFKQKPVFNLGSDTIICQNEFSLVLNKTIAGAEYLWQDGSTAPGKTLTKAGLYWMQATLNGCSFRDSLIITSQPVAPFSLGADTVLCGSQSLTLKVNNGAPAYLWNTGEITGSIVVAQSGLYWCETYSAAGCLYRDTILVTFQQGAKVDLGKDTSLCEGNFPFLLKPALAGASYLWQDGSTSPSYAVTRQGLYWVRATVNGCLTADSIMIGVKEKIPFSLGADTTLCSNQPLTLAANGSNGSYLWNTGSTAQSIAVNGSGIYWCEAISSAGCSYRDSIAVNYQPPLAFSLGADTILCDNAALLLDLTHVGDRYIWQNNSTESKFLVNKSGSYSVQVFKNGCIKKDTILVTFKSKPVPDLGPDRKFCPGDDLLLKSAANGSSFLWQDGTKSSSFKVLQPGTYSLAVTNECGTGTDDVVVLKGNCSVSIPSAFTPAKSQNNRFGVLNGSALKDFKLVIYNRWAQIVFLSTNPMESWDGTFKGLPQSTGTYVYSLTYKNPLANMSITTQRGTVTLLR